MKTARELMQDADTVGPETPTRALADTLLASGEDGVCVVDDTGRLIGVVTTMDLVFKEKKVHLPTFIAILDAVIPLGNMQDVEEEMRKIAGATAGDLMTRKVISVGPSDTMDQVATLMVEKHLTMVPVVDEGRLLGVVTKRSLLLGSGLATGR